MVPELFVGIVVTCVMLQFQIYVDSFPNKSDGDLEKGNIEEYFFRVNVTVLTPDEDNTTTVVESTINGDKSSNDDGSKQSRIYRIRRVRRDLGNSVLTGLQVFGKKVNHEFETFGETVNTKGKQVVQDVSHVFKKSKAE